MMVDSCDGVGANPGELALAPLRSFLALPGWAATDGRDVFYTYQGRNAIAIFCRFIDLREGDEVLAPAYNCGAEIDPFIKAGATVVLYDVSRRLVIDTDSIARSIRPATRVVCVTHFFGFHQNIESLAAECRRRGVLLLEDCGQALFSGGPERKVGGCGDAAIYSFVKTLAAPHGGALVIDRRLVGSPCGLAPPALKATLRGCLPLVKKWAMNAMPLARVSRALRSAAPTRRRSAAEGTNVGERPPMLSSNYFSEKQAGWAMSRVSRGILQAATPALIVETRRRNYTYLVRALTGIPGFLPVIESLPEGVCPMAFPFVAADRSYWYNELEARGILVQGWPGYYPGFDWDAYPDACYLKDTLLTLPVHQNLSLAHMEYMAGCVRELARFAPRGRSC